MYFQGLQLAVPFLIVVCTEGMIRLVNGTNTYEGRAEICINNTWSTICDNEWGLEEAVVVCNQLGFTQKGNDHESSAITEVKLAHILAQRMSVLATLPSYTHIHCIILILQDNL